ncbi:MAG: translesion error-prone DNA polymerase V autoproteolytic subunit [Candidatus Komeilibacteria bacterium]|nr:translesion error-prone DNA polymerase V autoproteolytic subunit [Candidatus Komeilibacteria bacterium]
MDKKVKQAGDKLGRYWRQHKRLPSFAEMADIFGYASKNAVTKLVAKLKDAHLVEQDASGRLVPGSLLTSLPVLGNVQAGFPSPAEEELVDSLTLDDYLINNPQSSFIIEVAGESMLDAGIQPKDLVIVDRGLTPKNNDIVLAQIDNEWTLKYFNKKGNKVSLQAANDKYPTLIPQSELTVAGVVVSSIRKYK